MDANVDQNWQIKNIIREAQIYEHQSNINGNFLLIIL